MNPLFVALHFEPYWKQENAADIKLFGASLS